MKILHVMADLDRRGGGPAQVGIEIAELMAKRGHEVTFISTDKGFPADLPLARKYVGGGSLTVEPYPVNWPALWKTSWAMRRRLMTAIPQADVVHIHSLYLFHTWIAASLCRRFNVPYILRPHGTLDPFMWRRHRYRKFAIELLFQNDVQRRAAGLHYTTLEERELAAPYAHNPQGWVVPNGVNLPDDDILQHTGALRARYPQIGDRRIILFFGRLNFKKGVDITIEMFAELARVRPDIFLVIAGPDAGVQKSAERRVAEFGLVESVLFTGMLEGADKWMALSGSDIFVLPSFSENFGVSVVEAAACGLPVVISDRVNLWRDFVEAGAGVVAPPTAAAFARQVQELLDNPAETAAMAKRGADFVRRHFAWAALGDQYEAMYREAAVSL